MPNIPGEHEFRKSAKHPNIFEQSSVSQYTEKDALGVMRRPAAKPLMKRFSSEGIDEQELLIIAILSLYRYNPLFFPINNHTEDGRQWFRDVIQLIRDPGNTALPLSALRTYIHQANWMLDQPPGSNIFEAAGFWLGVTV